MFSGNRSWLLVCDLQWNGQQARLAIPAVHVARVLAAHRRNVEARAWPWAHHVPAKAPWWIVFHQVQGAFPAVAVQAPKPFSKQAWHPVPSVLKNWAQRYGFTGFVTEGADIMPIWTPERMIALSSGEEERRLS